MARYKRAGWVMAIALLVPALCTGTALAGPTGLVDDFSGDLSAWTITRILNDQNHSPDNTYNFQITDGAVEINTTSYVGIEQYAMTRTDFTLDVGETLQADYINDNLDMQDIGLYVGAGHPTMDVRQDYVSIYVRNNGQLFSRGFNGTTEFGLSGGGTPTVQSLFVTRSAADAYELGWFEGGIRNVLVTRTGTPGITGGAIGVYTDVRGTGIRGSLDNVRIIPALVPGDVDGNTLVNMLDFNIIAMNFFNTGQTRMQGDLTGDGTVEFADFRQWKANVPPEMGASALASLFGPAVPEPATSALALIAGTWLVVARRRRWSPARPVK